MAELRTKVMAGRFKPITPGKYSADLINLMGQLLQVNPQRRPEVSKILASSVVQKHAAGGSHKAAAEPSSKGNVLQTIKVRAIKMPALVCLMSATVSLWVSMMREMHTSVFVKYV